MRIGILTKEFPPHIYGGAGVHVENLVRELANLEQGRNTIEVRCFGEQKETVANKNVIGADADLCIPVQDPRHRILLDTLLRDILIVGSLKDVDIIHCHTWYTHLAGCLLKSMLDVPLVLTTHSLEPNRTWKRDQLGNGYHASSWLEKTAYQNADGVIAVSESMREDVHRAYGVPLERIEVIHNGIDPDVYKPQQNPDIIASYGIDLDKPFALMVSRITRQKGITHFLDSVKYMDPEIQAVLCASSPDTEELMREVGQKIDALQQERPGRVIWIPEIAPLDTLITLYTQASVFVCPSIYEPFGLINLEAMACGTPVVASAVGGIPEIIVDGQTGILARFRPIGAQNAEPEDPDGFARTLAGAVNKLIADPQRLEEMGRLGRKRVEDHFTWKAVAAKTLDFYSTLMK